MPGVHQSSHKVFILPQYFGKIISRKYCKSILDILPTTSDFVLYYRSVMYVRTLIYNFILCECDFDRRVHVMSCMVRSTINSNSFFHLVFFRQENFGREIGFFLDIQCCHTMWLRIATSGNTSTVFQRKGY